MGTSGRRSYQMNISIPRELKDRMDAAGEPVNWSRTAAEAFEAKLRELEARKMPEDMDDVVARLRAVGEKEAKEEYQAGLEAGRAWARDDATPGDLRRLQAAGEGLDAEELAYSVWPHLRRGGFNSSASEFWESALGEEDADRAGDPDFLHGFEVGACEVWEAVKHKL